MPTRGLTPRTPENGNTVDMKLLNDAGLNIDDHALKLAAAVCGAIGDVLVAWGMPEGKAGPLMAAITLITSLLIAGISHVQANKLKAQGAIAAAAKKPPETPATQFNVASDVSNKTATPDAAQPLDGLNDKQLDALLHRLAIRQRALREEMAKGGLAPEWLAEAAKGKPVDMPKGT